MNYYKTTIAGICIAFKHQIYLFWNNPNCFEKQRNAYQILLQYWSDFICSKQWMFIRVGGEINGWLPSLHVKSLWR